MKSKGEISGHCKTCFSDQHISIWIEVVIICRIRIPLEQALTSPGTTSAAWLQDNNRWNLWPLRAPVHLSKQQLPSAQRWRLKHSAKLRLACVYFVRHYNIKVDTRSTSNWTSLNREHINHCTWALGHHEFQVAEGVHRQAQVFAHSAFFLAKFFNKKLNMTLLVTCVLFVLTLPPPQFKYRGPTLSWWDPQAVIFTHNTVGCV